MQLRVLAVLDSMRPVGAIPHAGTDADGVVHLWLSDAMETLDSTASVVRDRAFDTLEGYSVQHLLSILRHWPAWQLTQLARLELGSGALVVGDGWLAREVLAMCRLRGCLWRATWGSFPSGLVEHAFPVEAPGHLVASKLPRKPDAVIVFADSMIPAAASLAEDHGTLVVASGTQSRAIDWDLYSDVHRRGLRVEIVDPYSRSPRSAVEWPLAATRIAAMIADGALARLPSVSIE